MPKTLDQIEKSRRRIVDEIVKLTGLSAEDISVDISLHNQTDESELAIEARELGWSPERYEGSAWYELDSQVDAGSMSVFVE